MQVSSYIEFGITIEILGLYKITPTIYFEPFTIHPFEQWLLWFRPIADDYNFDNVDLNIYSSVYYECCKVYVTWEEHLLVTQKSLIDYAMDTSSTDIVPNTIEEWAYNPLQTIEYDDSFWHFELAE